ncbi:nitroreductase [Roseomonas alkaliterrae]|uniref:Nitroreductase n=1 Tax=Neoroseomonas alkaliterrae TaxID=1452450 RepID=A0A840XN26_9PROT|nr:nitroreductase [Neoroseomonas alkaliterrae]MBB5689306.1 nitroreductase [Neoroseomonas alkaliterrae]MBR0675853.1 nitroreductase [Neoroseomonas alkaliterrae]
MHGTADPVAAAITSRRSVRAFLGTPVPRETVERILDIAARAPSGTNMQPWRGYVLTGEPLRRLSDALVAEAMAGTPVEGEYRYYPEAFFEPYLSRRRKVGWDLYGLLGIAKGETEKMKRQHARNYTFFGAPVGIIFTIHRRLEIGSWLDYGIFLGNVMTAARGMGLDTCPQAAFAPHHRTIREHLPIPEEEVVVCGMALGHADPAAPENALVTERVPAREFCRFLGWG